MTNLQPRVPLLPLLALLTAFPPLATDMYLPAIPLLVSRWAQPLAVVNLALVGFFISYCLFLLVYGPLSDRFGRRPPLLWGIGLFVAASFGCALCDNVVILIVCRVFQAAGAASASALGLAITKDVFEGKRRENMLAYIGVMMALAPMLAPVIGGWIVTWFSWRWIFVVQATIGLVAMAGVWQMPETLPSPSVVSARATLSVYVELLANRRYLGLALLFSLAVLPHFAFIAGSADIYITGFGMTERRFGAFFALNAAALMSGSLVCARLPRQRGSGPVITTGLAGIFLGGMLMVTGWLSGPWSLALPMAVVSFSLGLSRPPSNHLVLEQVDRHAGAASSLLMFVFFILGAGSMWLISQPWADKVRVIGLLAAGAGGLMSGLWLTLAGSLRRRLGPGAVTGQAVTVPPSRQG